MIDKAASMRYDRHSRLAEPRLCQEMTVTPSSFLLR